MIEETNRKRKELMDELASLGNLIRGTLVHTTRKCGVKGCHCMNGGAKHPVVYMTISTHRSRNRTVHVERSIESRVAAGIAAYKRAWEIIEELGVLNMAGLKEEAREAKKKAKAMK